MSKQMLSIRIDVTKIDKSKLYVGTKGTYLDVVLFINDDTDQYGNNGMITQSVSKEERDRGVKGAILGNSKPIGTPQPVAQYTPPQQNTFPTNQPDPTDLPF